MGKREEERFDAALKEHMQRIVQDEQPSDFCKARIDREIDRQLSGTMRRRGEYRMKRWTIKKLIATAAVACMLIGGTALAAGGMAGIYSGSTRTNRFNKYEKLPQAMMEAGLDVSLPEQIGDYSYATAEIVNNENRDDAGTVLESWKGVDATYRNNKGDEVSVNIEPASYFAGADEEHLKTVWEIGDIKVNYTEYVMVVAPLDHELTQEEKDALGPNVVVSYGDADMEPTLIQTAGFTKDDILFSVLSIDENIPEEEFRQFAESIVEANNE